MWVEAWWEILARQGAGGGEKTKSIEVMSKTIVDIKKNTNCGKRGW